MISKNKWQTMSYRFAHGGCKRSAIFLNINVLIAQVTCKHNDNIQTPNNNFI